MDEILRDSGVVWGGVGGRLVNTVGGGEEVKGCSGLKLKDIIQNTMGIIYHMAQLHAVERP